MRELSNRFSHLLPWPGCPGHVPGAAKGGPHRGRATGGAGVPGGTTDRQEP